MKLAIAAILFVLVAVPSFADDSTTTQQGSTTQQGQTTQQGGTTQQGTTTQPGSAGSSN